MRQQLALSGLLLVCGCQSAIEVPTAQELVASPQLLTEWQSKCDTGEYSHLASVEKASLCSTTQEASMTIVQMKAAKKDSAFFGTMSKRK